MPFTSEQLQYGAKAAIDFYLKNDPIDNINVAHPLLKKLIAGKQEWGGGLQYVVEQLRFSNDSNAQSYFGDQQVTYNRKRTLEQAKYTWGDVHDGFGLNEDELKQNGIIMTDDRNATPSGAEKVQLNNLLEENYKTLKLGTENFLDLAMHRNGTASSTDVPGLDLLVQTDPTVSSVIGTINQSTNTWWRNNAQLSIVGTTTALIDAMEVQWRNCTRYGGSTPDFILAGSDFMDAYRQQAGGNAAGRPIGYEAQKGGVALDASMSGLYFKGVEIVWDPVFDILQAQDSATPSWLKRCYFLNTKFMKLRPIKGNWMVSRTPPRVYDRYVHYFGLTNSYAMTISKRNAQAVLAIA